MATNLIPSDGTSVFDVLTTLQGTNPNAVAAIVRPNNPPPGIGGFLFDYIGNELTELRSRITDYYIENNTVINDQWSLEPERVTVHAMMAELVTGQALQGPPQTVPTPLPLNAPMVPSTSPQTNPTSSVPTGNSIYQYYEQQSVISNLSGPIAGAQAPRKQTRQSDAFLFFKNLWTGRQLCSVETPYGIWTDMAIENLRAEQPDESNQYSEFLIVFKKMRFAADITVNVGQLSGRAVNQQSPTTQTQTSGSTALTPAQGNTVVNSWLLQTFGP